MREFSRLVSLECLEHWLLYSFPMTPITSRARQGARNFRWEGRESLTWAVLHNTVGQSRDKEEESVQLEMTGERGQILPFS